MRALVVLVEFLLWLLLLRFVLRTLAALFGGRPRAAQPRPARPQVKAPEDLVLDRVCHTYVPRSHAVAARVAGRDEWFCSDGCRARALAAVAKAS